MGNCKAKRNVQFKSTDERIMNFIKNNTYRYIFQTDDVIVFDGNGNYVVCNIDVFDMEFELLN